MKTTGFKPICETVINKGIEKLVTIVSEYRRPKEEDFEFEHRSVWRISL